MILELLPVGFLTWLAAKNELSAGAMVYDSGGREYELHTPNQQRSILLVPDCFGFKAACGVPLL